MKKQLTQLRRFFSKTGVKKLNATAAREVIPASYDDDDGSNRLSGAFIVVLLLHVIALVGVFAFSRMKDPKEAVTSRTIETQNVKPAPKASATVATAALPPLPAAALAPEPEPAGLDRLPVPDPVRIEPNGDRTYVVKSGDNLTKIAVAYNVRPADLISANKLKGDEIKPGQELIIPDNRGGGVAKITEAKIAKAPEKAQTSKGHASSYTVRKNDTLVKIARSLGVSYEELTKANNIKDPRKLQEGQVLKVPRKS